MAKRKQLNVRIDPDLLDQLRMLARAKHLSLARMVQRALTRYYLTQSPYPKCMGTDDEEET